MAPSSRVRGLVLVSLLLATVSGYSRDDFPNFPVTRDCLYMCAICVERWGSIYNGRACAETCERTLGKEMDRECSQGSQGKRYPVQEAVCMEACRKCVPEVDKAAMHKCFSTCLATGVHKVAC